MLKSLLAIEKFCRQNKIDHRFVGGAAYTGWLTPTTTWTINSKLKTINLRNCQPPTKMRTDRSLRDIDLIVLNPSKIRNLKLKTFIKSHPEFPPLNVEFVTTRTSKKSHMPQFVTSVERNNKRFYLVFDHIRVAIRNESLAPWRLNNLTVRHPYGDYLAYHFRNPSGLKPKDADKIKLLKKLAEQTPRNQEFDSWEKYIEILKNATGKTRIKAHMIKWYWSTIGSTLAHGKLKFTRPLLALANRFTGSVQ